MAIFLGTNRNDNLVGSSENDTLTGYLGNDFIVGGIGNDILFGNEGNDTLDGGTGDDILNGGTNDDTYIVNSSADSVTENLNEGTDTVKSAISWTLGENLENLLLTGSGAINGTGNTLNNTLTGNGANNTLTGGSGNDTLDGGTGDDILNGGTNDDTYIVNSSADSVTENLNEGTDTVKSAVSWTLSNNLENLLLTGSGAINGTGNTLNNTLTGNGANNTLTGGGGNDTLIGGSGNDTLDGGTGDDILNGGTKDDTYIVDSSADSVTENLNEGTDTVKSAISWTLGENLENLLLTGSGAINGTGNTLNNTLTGNSANNTLTGGGGNDTLDGGTGDDILSGGTNDDTYIVNSSADSVTENLNEGTDTVKSAVSWTLSNNLENLLLTGSGTINGTGNTFNNTLTGNGANNTLTGGGGNDTLIGGSGNDTLWGTSGGAIGEIDTLVGGSKADRFILGTTTQVFYDDSNTVTDGIIDYASIADFNTAEDFIQLQGAKTNYLLASSPVGLPTGTAIYRDKPDSEPDELIGIIQGKSGLSLDSSYFSFVSPSILQLSAANFSVKEYGTRVVTVTVTRTGSSHGAVSATVSPSNGSAIAPADYNSNPIVVSFADGDTAAKTVVIPIVDDGLVENTETINLSLGNPTGSGIIGTQNTAVLSILDNDVADIQRDPRLFLDATRISQIKSAIGIDGSHHQQAFNAMKARVDQNNWQVYDINPNDGEWNYARSYLAKEASLMYLLTDDPQYAQIAYNTLYEVHNNPEPDNRLPESSSHGLARARVGENFAIAYDWAYNGWTQEQRGYIKGKIDLALDAWPSYSHVNLSSNKGSNWVAVCRGGELVMMLAVGEEQQRASRYSDLKSWLNTHLQVAYGNLGVSQEGIGYTGYGGTFLLPAVYALRSVGDTSLDANFDTKAFWQQAMYAGAFTMDQQHGERKFLQSGVSHGGIIDEGWASLLLGSVPQDQLPYYRYFYDHHAGVDAPGTPAQKFDDRNGGTVWSLIYYPENTPSLNPTGTFSQAVSDDDKGAYFFRNRWQNANDVLVSIMADAEHHSRGWDQSEAFALNLMAYNTRFSGGPATNRNSSNFSALLVDGQAQTNGGITTGTKEFFSSNPDGGGYVIVDGGQKYANLGVSSAKRHLLVDFSGNAGTAILSTLDHIQDESNHTYTWQLNIGDESSDDGITTTIGNEGGLPTFILSGNNDSYVKGWVLYPTDATLVAGDPLQAITSGANADIWVVMVTGTGAIPVATVTGTGMDSVLEVGNARIRYDLNSNRIVTESTAALVNLMGTVGNDVLTGNAGANVIEGGAGVDILTGQSGADVFVYGTPSAGRDTITDFNVDDSFQIAASVFGGGLRAGTPLSQTAAATGVFVQGDIPVPIGNSANFLYNTTTGLLSFDRDGIGLGGAVAIATITGAVPLSSEQFIMF